MTMSDNKNDHVVIAIFENEDFANYGIDLLKKWDWEEATVKLGAIGVIQKKGDKIKTHVPHKTGKGAKVGTVLGIITAVLTGGTSWIVGAAGGAALGGAAGAFFKKSLHLSKEEVQALGQELERGRVAVVVTCDEHEVDATSAKLTQYGGDVKGYAVPEAALTEAAAAGVTIVDEVATSDAAEDEAPVVAEPEALDVAGDETPMADKQAPAADAIV
jgi:hypothetical protein